MVPKGWTPYHRVEDEELLGYLADTSEGTVPLTLFGVPLGAAGPREEAEQVLRARGLASLADPWVLRQEDGDELRVAVVSAYPDRVLVVPAPYGYADPLTRPVVVRAEDGPDRLRPLA